MVIMDLVIGGYNMFKDLYEGYMWTLTLEEPVTQRWLLVKSPVPMICLIILYFHMVYFGPKLMQKREAFKLKWVLVIYNLGITLLNLYIAVTLFHMAHKLQYSWICEPYRYISTQEEEQIAGALWWYWFSKLIEFVDTLFFILRKKDRQLTFLHIYHHSTMFFLWWIGVKWVPGGASFVGAGLNSVVHVLMYSYYCLSAFGPTVQKYLWWKKYLTMIQLAQFSIALVLGLNGMRINCDFPKWMQYALITYMLSFIVLFGNFYRHAYNKQKNGRRLKKLDENGKPVAVNGNGYHMANGTNGYLKQNGSSSMKNGTINQNGTSSLLKMNGTTTTMMNGHVASTPLVQRKAGGN